MKNHHQLKVESHLTENIKHHTGWFTGLGIVFLLLGIAAIAFPWVATLSLEIAIGLLLILAGAAQGVQSFSIPRWKGFLLSVALSALALILGVLMVFFPFAGAATLTAFVAAYLLLGGVMKTVFALQVKPVIGWGWSLVSGLLSLLLGLLILLLLEDSFLWVLGLLLGIDFLFAGIWMLALATTAKQMIRDEQRGEAG